MARKRKRLDYEEFRKLLLSLEVDLGRYGVVEFQGMELQEVTRFSGGLPVHVTYVAFPTRQVGDNGQDKDSSTPTV